MSPLRHAERNTLDKKKSSLRLVSKLTDINKKIMDVIGTESMTLTNAQTITLRQSIEEIKFLIDWHTTVARLNS